MDWQECRNKRFVKEVKIDKNLISSLLKSSKRRFESDERLKLDETTASTKISVAYEALREILEALAIAKGFKIYNHECFCSFLDEICKDKPFSVDFDRFRKIRNQINYYGKDIPAKEAEIIIKEIILLSKKITDKYLSLKNH